MTPAERARLIDRQEFEADCAAARRRAYEHLDALASSNDDRTRQWLNKPYEPGTFIRSAPPIPAKPKPEDPPRIVSACANGNRGTGGRPVHKHTADGKTLTLQQWAGELGTTARALYQRIQNHGSLEAVIARHKKKESRA